MVYYKALEHLFPTCGSGRPPKRTKPSSQEDGEKRTVLLVRELGNWRKRKDADFSSLKDFKVIRVLH